jgi:hypothetical protein
VTRNNYKIVRMDKKIGEKKVPDYKEIYGYKKSDEKVKKIKKLSMDDETKEPIKYGKFTRHHPDDPDNQKFRHTQTTNKVKPYRRD